MTLATRQADLSRDVGLARVLGVGDLTAIGLGATIGAGIFVLTGTAPAQFAGPAITLSFLLAALASLCVALCYAELAAMLPDAGGAYSYAYAAFGKGVAWLVGWLLTLELLFGAAAVAVTWSGYFSDLLNRFGVSIPDALMRAPLEADGLWRARPVSGALFNLPALALVLALTIVGCAGIRPAALLNRVLVLVKIAAILIIVCVGFAHVSPSNWHPFLPPNAGTFGRFGWSGVMVGSFVVYFAFFGFEMVTLTASEARDPERDVSRGVLASLGVTTVLYLCMALVVTGLAKYQDLNAPHPLLVAVDRVGASLGWFPAVVNFAVVAGLATVGLVMVLGQARVLFMMARDGLLPSRWATLGAKTRAPVAATVAAGLVIATVAGFMPIGLLMDSLNVAALLVFVAVCAAALVLRRRYPNARRPYRAPLIPLVPAVGAAFSVATLVSLPPDSSVRVLLWIALGAVGHLVFARMSDNRKSREEFRLPG